MVAALSGFFAVLAALIAAIGLYGVMMYSVTNRTREIGIRMALGAHRGMVIGPILREAAILAAAGLVVGMVCALGLSKLVASLLFEMTPSDRGTFAASGVSMAAVSLAAGYLLARRAAQVDLPPDYAMTRELSVHTESIVYTMISSERVHGTSGTIPVVGCGDAVAGLLFQLCGPAGDLLRFSLT
jgi:putative ABC transport system permease protein